MARDGQAVDEEIGAFSHGYSDVRWGIAGTEKCTKMDSSRGASEFPGGWSHRRSGALTASLHGYPDSAY
ncbi:hypothetical protein EYZ11_005469 [Aspergillus tanneri]|uniref:Uncharacterized protein n=1 Tax=Aspergillus tanneri TaxID=1220188 RepID=A0A4S3JNT8_9EURO|nr:hypothetical protein EYZ11_005469 [Aspergillus tanneri]